MGARKRPAYRAHSWEAVDVRALRKHLGFSQEELARELGMRQQTVSEWETGQYQPRGASARLLGLIAEEAGFEYRASGPENQDSKSEHRGRST